MNKKSIILVFLIIVALLAVFLIWRKETKNITAQNQVVKMTSTPTTMPAYPGWKVYSAESNGHRFSLQYPGNLILTKDPHSGNTYVVYKDPTLLDIRGFILKTDSSHDPFVNAFNYLINAQVGDIAHSNMPEYYRPPDFNFTKLPDVTVNGRKTLHFTLSINKSGQSFGYSDEYVVIYDNKTYFNFSVSAGSEADDNLKAQVDKYAELTQKIIKTIRLD